MIACFLVAHQQRGVRPARRGGRCWKEQSGRACSLWDFFPDSRTDKRWVGIRVAPQPDEDCSWSDPYLSTSEACPV